jgi:hypothetical protein
MEGGDWVREGRGNGGYLWRGAPEVPTGPLRVLRAAKPTGRGSDTGVLTCGDGRMEPQPVRHGTTVQSQETQ